MELLSLVKLLLYSQKTFKLILTLILVNIRQSAMLMNKLAIFKKMKEFNRFCRYKSQKAKIRTFLKSVYEIQME